MSNDLEIVQALEIASPIINAKRSIKYRSSKPQSYSEEQHRALVTVLAYELEIPVSTLQYSDFRKYYELFAGRNVRKYQDFISAAFPVSSAFKKDSMNSFLSHLGFPGTAEDTIEAKKSGSIVFWDRLSWDEIYRIVDKAADEKGIPIEYVNMWFLDSNKFDFLNKRNIGGLRFYANSHDEKEKNENTTHFLRRKLGLPDIPTGQRARFRMSRIQQIYDEFSFPTSESPSIDQLLPWTEQVANVYQNFFYNIEPDQAQNEIWIASSEVLAGGVTNATEFLQELHKRLEKIFSKDITRVYREKTLDVSKEYGFESGRETKKDMLIYEAPPVSPVEHFPEGLRVKIRHLTREQQFIINGIMVNTWNFDTLAEEFGRTFKRVIDVDELQEVYQDALMQLRESITGKDNEE